MSVIPGLREKFHEAAVQATEEVFENQIKPAAKADCPVRTGKNRESIDVSFRDRLDVSWVSAWLYTASGYGWLIERGTSKDRALTRMNMKRRNGRVAKDDRTPARPYIYPAISRFVGQIPQRAREIFERMLSQ